MAYICVRCKFEFQLDDVAIDYGDGRCLCLRCYTHLAHLERRMPRDLQQDISRAANEGGQG